MRTAFKNELIQKAGGIFVFVLTLITAASLFAQPYIGWIQRYNGPGNGDDLANEMAIDRVGNIYVMGTSRGNGTGSDIVTLKYDTRGDLLWEQRYNGPGSGDDKARSIQLDSIGNVYVLGSSTGVGTSEDYTVIKYSSNSNRLWAARFNREPFFDISWGLCCYSFPANGADIPLSFAVGTDGNIYVTGTSWSGGLRGWDWVITEFSPQGALLGMIDFQYGPGSIDGGPAAVAASGGKVYIAGGIEGISLDFFSNHLIKFSSGRFVWDKLVPSVPQISLLAIDKHDNIYVGGAEAANSYNYKITKLDSTGSVLWSQAYDGTGSGSDILSDMIVDQSGNAYVTGRSRGTHSGDDYVTIKYDSLGNSLWTRQYNGPANYHDNATALALDNGGNVYVTGYAMTEGNSNDFATVKYDSQGNESWVYLYNGPANSSDEARDVAVDSTGYVYVAGSSIGDKGDYDIVVIKYSSVPILKGDLDENGVLTLKDIVSLLNCVFLGSGSCPPEFADVNCDAVLSAADVVVLLLTFYAAAPPPC